MSKTNTFTVFTAFISLLVVLSIPEVKSQNIKSGQLVKRVVEFTETNLPRVNGTIINKKNNTYYAEINRSIPPLSVQVIRQVVRSSDQGTRVTEKTIATVRMIPENDNLARVQASPKKLNKIEVGDKIRWFSDELFLLNDSDIPSSDLLQKLRKTDLTNSVTLISSEENLPEDSKKFLLRVNSDNMELKRVDEWGSIASEPMQPPRTRIPGKRGARESGQPKLSKYHKSSRVIYDFELFTFESDRNLNLVVFAGKDSIGIGRQDRKGISNLHWSTVSGTVLELNPLKRSEQQNSEKTFYLIAVVEDEDHVYSRLLKYNVYDRSVQTLWSAKNVWIRDSGQTFTGQKIGLNSVFKQTAYPVKITSDSWDWASDSTEYPDRIQSPAYKMINSRIIRMNGDGQISIFSNGSKLASSPQKYGQSPVTISPRRSQSEQNLHPTFSAWKQDDQNLNILVPDNIVGGVSFIKSLQSYKSSRLFLLSFDGNRITSDWESKRLSGYISSIDRHDSEEWVSIVNTDDGTSRIMKISNLESVN